MFHSINLHIINQNIRKENCLVVDIDMNTSDTRLRIAAIIAVHNRLEFTQKCLSSLSSASNNHEVTVILVDDGSTD